MQRVNRASAVTTMPAPPAGGTPGFFTAGDPGLGQPATVPGFEWFNGVQEELIALITRGGITASNADLEQVRKSLDRLFGGAITTLSANATLTVDNAGEVLVNAAGGARTITLPAANALAGRPIRCRIVKTDSSVNQVTVQRAGADTIEGATSQLLRFQWDSLTLVSDGVGAWMVSAGGLGARSLANPGWARLPGGLILQWGVTNSVDVAPAGTSVSATFPIAFPNEVLNLQGTLVLTSAAGNVAVANSSFTLTSCAFQLNEWTAQVQNAGVRYLAIGW